MKQVLFILGLLSLVSVAAEAVAGKSFSKSSAVVFEPEIQNMDVCFSPKEKCDKKIISFINSAKKSLEVAIYSLTHRDIVSAIKAAKDRGVKVRVIADREQMDGPNSLVKDLMQNVDVKIGGSKGIMHNKYTIVDGQKIETGSYNYTSSASHFNSENQIYIFEEPVVKEYMDDYEKLWAAAVDE